MHILCGKKQRVAACIMLAVFIGAAFPGCMQPPAGQPPVSPGPEPPVEEPLGEIESKYRSIIESYLAQIPSAQQQAPASDEAQQQILDGMADLYADRATSRQIVDAYRTGIVSLSPDMADRFAEYAVAGMRRNSFEDHAAIGAYTSLPDFLDRFFTEAEQVDFSYFELNRDPSRIRDADVRRLVEEAGAQGYIVASAEGMLFYVVDFTVFAQYRACNTSAMASLLETLAIDTIDPMASDAALIVPWDAVAARAWNMERMLLAESDTPSRYREFIAVRFKDHLRLLFFGIDNTPAFDYSTGAVTEETRAVLSDAATFDGMQLGRLAAAHLAIIRSNGGKADDEARAALNALLDGLDPIYGSGGPAEEAFGGWMSGTL